MRMTLAGDKHVVLRRLVDYGVEEGGARDRTTFALEVPPESEDGATMPAALVPANRGAGRAAEVRKRRESPANAIGVDL